MVYFFVVISLIAHCFISDIAKAEITVRGRVNIKDSIYYLQFDNKKSDHLIIAVDDLVQSHLKCLRTGDYLSGTASMINGTHIALKSVEYVGLKKLLTNWRNDNEIFHFSDFKTLHYWQFNKDLNKARGPFPYHYILSPHGHNHNNCSWKIFITNDTEVVFGILKWIFSNQIQLDIYDSNNGEVLMTKKLIQSSK